MNNKKIFIASLLLVSTLLTGCAKTYKKASGVNMLWKDEVGYLSRAASAFEENNMRYVVYETNSKKNDETISFALRKAQLVEGEWKFENKKTTILKASEKGWDRFIFSPSIVKGEFKKGSETYNYLLAYGGRKTENDIANQIGIAYAKTLDGEWIKHDEPVIKYDADELGDEYGAGAPSLVSFDKAGKVRMFYSYAETNLANERIVDCDFSDLNNIIIDKGTRQISVKGLRDNTDVTILSNADFALDQDGQIYLARDVYPLSGNLPGNATSVQFAKADVDILNDFVNYSWSVLETLNTSMTIDYDDEESMGWDEIYSPAIVTDPYGYLLNDESFDCYYSTADEPEIESDISYKWSSNLAYRTVRL